MSCTKFAVTMYYRVWNYYKALAHESTFFIIIKCPRIWRGKYAIINSISGQTLRPYLTSPISCQIFQILARAPVICAIIGTYYCNVFKVPSILFKVIFKKIRSSNMALNTIQKNIEENTLVC